MDARDQDREILRMVLFVVFLLHSLVYLAARRSITKRKEMTWSS